MAVLVKDVSFVFGGLKIAIMEHLLHVQFWATVSVTLIVQSRMYCSSSYFLLETLHHAVLTLRLHFCLT